jgi:triacylglycerol esterase/lipase EstA (alpha/beta hydrolase family)
MMRVNAFAEIEKLYLSHCSLVALWLEDRNNYRNAIISVIGAFGRDAPMFKEQGKNFYASS